jgi:hypothetical protein
MPLVAVVDGAPAGPFAIGHPMFNSMAIGGSATTARALAAGLTPDPALLAGGRKIASTAAAFARDGPFRSTGLPVDRDFRRSAARPTPYGGLAGDQYSNQVESIQTMLRS